MLGKCKFCEFEEHAKCSKKGNITVKLNKRRQCSMFVVNEEKAADFLERRAKHKVETIKVPSWYWIRDLRREAVSKAKAEQLDQFATTAVPDKHPLTGDLSRFGSTAQPSK